MKGITLKIQLLFLAIVALGFNGCIRDASNVNIPTIEPQLVVQCFISPQDPVTRVYVSLSSPVFSSISSQAWVDSANVKISDGTVTVPLQYTISSSEIHYEADSSLLKIIPGKTYTLWVSTYSGITVKASCMVPFPVDTASLVYNWDTIPDFNSVSGGVERTVKLNMEWRDMAGGINYYRAGADVMTFRLNAPNTTLYQNMYNNAYSDLLTDKNKDGGLMAMRDLSTTVIEYFGGMTGDFSYRPKGIKMYLLNCDENYYKYHETANKNDSGNPFAEPVLVYSNIQGGLGCFGACNQFIKQIDF